MSGYIIVSNKMSFKDGDRITCVLDNNKINDAKLTIAPNGWFACQNVMNGAYCRDKKGYKHSWFVSSLKACNVIKVGVREF